MRNGDGDVGRWHPLPAVSCFKIGKEKKIQRTNGMKGERGTHRAKRELLKMNNVFYFRIPFRCTLIIFVIQFPLTCLDNVLLKSKEI